MMLAELQSVPHAAAGGGLPEGAVSVHPTGAAAHVQCGDTFVRAAQNRSSLRGGLQNEQVTERAEPDHHTG
eukprot:COSAG06_NODE_4213_length_4471_cov_2.922919_3_plen_71_part_00